LQVNDDGPAGLDGVRVCFDDERVVSDAGVALVATLAERLGIEALVKRFLLLRRDRPGAANAGRKVMALIYAMLLGADCIDDCELLRAGRTRRLLGGWLPAPSTLGTFLRAFTFGHVRQLDRVLAESLRRAWRAGAGPGDGRLVVDVDSFIGEVHGYKKQGVGFGTPRSAGITRCSPAALTAARCCTSACARARANSSRGVVRLRR
jgi:Transposase DDE domain group 1